MDIETAMPCGLIANELVTNALKHAFVGHTRGHLELSLEEVNGPEGRCLALEVTDDGIGFPQDFDLEDSGTLGLKLVSVLADQLGGVMDIRHQSGTAVRVVFPAPGGDQSDSGLNT